MMEDSSRRGLYKACTCTVASRSMDEMCSSGGRSIFFSVSLKERAGIAQHTFHHCSLMSLRLRSVKCRIFNASDIEADGNYTTRTRFQYLTSTHVLAPFPPVLNHLNTRSCPTGNLETLSPPSSDFASSACAVGTFRCRSPLSARMGRHLTEPFSRNFPSSLGRCLCPQKVSRWHFTTSA